MISLIDADKEEVLPGNLDVLKKDLNEAVAESSDSVDGSGARTDNGHDKPSQRKIRTVEVNDDELPENLRGKDFKDIVRIYQDSQSTIGRMANDLGTQRKLTDRLLDLKRDEDLQRNGANPAKVQVSGTELLDNPTEAIDRIVNARLAEQERVSSVRLAQLESQQYAQSFASRHPDWQEIASDSSFHQFVQASPYRARAAVAASQGDWGAAEELVSEFKDRKQTLESKQKADKEVKDKSNLDAANKASLESGASASKPYTGGKILRRVDLLKLQMEQPEVYYDEETQRVIMKAYSENRVK